MQVRALGYLGFGVSDVPAWQRFSTDVLGLRPAGPLDDGTLLLRMDEYAFRFALHPGGSDDLAYTGWQVADRAEFDALIGRIEASGRKCTPGTPAQAAARCVSGLSTCLDPSGIMTELFWGPHIDVRDPFVPSRNIRGFDTRDKGLGHIVLAVDDLAASVAFYCDVLGMRVSDYIDFDVLGMPVSLTFLHCNTRHHSLALMQRPGAPRRTAHIMLELYDLDDVGATYALCEAQKIPLATTLGRHSNDLMFSFYVESPSGFTVEYGCGARLIDDRNWHVQTYNATSIWGHRRLSLAGYDE